MNDLTKQAGAVVWWTAPRLVAVPLDTARSAARGTALFAHLRGAPVEPHTAMRRAVRRSHGGAHARTVAYWQELPPAPDGRLVVVYAEESGSTVDDYSASAAFGVLVDGVSGATEIVGVPPTPAAQDSLASLLDRYDLERGALTAQDMAGAITSALRDEAKAIAVKAGGAIYWVAPDRAPVVDGIAEALARMEHEGAPQLRRVAVDVNTAEGFADDARASLSDDIAAIRAELADMGTLPSARGAGRRADALAARATKIAEIDARAYYLETVLSRDLDDVRALARKAKAEADALADDLRAAIVDGRIA